MLIIPAVLWEQKTFGITFREIYFTLYSPLAGADTSFLGDAIISHAYIFFICMAIMICILVIDAFGGRLKRILKKRKIHVAIKRKHFRRAIAGCMILLLVVGLGYANHALGVSDFIYDYMNPTDIYENYYVDPDSVVVKAPLEKKNLLYIYMESMETTYSSRDVGGYQEINYIPNLTAMSEKNISFSNSSNFGGWHVISGTGWTMGSLFATSSGVPFSFPVFGNDMDKRETFAPGIVTLGDILKHDGYGNGFLCGSYGSFGGRSLFYSTHGNYTVYDYIWANWSGRIPEGYSVWWGYDDRYLYKIAKELLTYAKDSDAPWNITMLTADTHHIDGYVCPLCGNEYGSQLENVVKCADNQIKKFIEWCKSQPWYEDTVIVICGDHPRMDTSLVEGIEDYDRTVFNCFINTAETSEYTKNREFTAMDMFPTVLSALGYEIEGDKLGLGTDLFSGKKTLCEEIGYEELNRELAKFSSYYIEEFD